MWFQVANHLIEQGCRRIAMVTASLKRNVYVQRYKGYLDAHAEKNLPVDEKLLIINDLSEQAALEAAAGNIENESFAGWIGGNQRFCRRRYYEQSEGKRNPHSGRHCHCWV
jgi:DNA-binding LacI/PurR family transcriptional regulator